MMKWFVVVFLMGSLALPVSALELEAPEVPMSGQALMPDSTTSFSQGLKKLMQKAIRLLRPDMEDALRMGCCLVCIALVLSLTAPLSSQSAQAVKTTGCWAIASSLFLGTRAMVPMAVDTIRELSDYGMLLLPVMTAALAAQGGTTASAAMYAGTAAFNALLSKLVTGLLIPLIYLYLGLGIANCATGENMLRRFQDLVKGFVSWSLKTLLTGFTTYMSITGVISGTTDAAVLKAAKVTISTAVPVVGGILSDASETVLISAGLMKNAAGVYGILACLAIFLSPFLHIGSYYLSLKGTAALCSAFSGKETICLMDDFSCAMGLLLAITGAECLMVLISTVCFLKGVG